MYASMNSFSALVARDVELELDEEEDDELVFRDVEEEVLVLRMRWLFDEPVPLVFAVDLPELLSVFLIR